MQKWKFSFIPDLCFKQLETKLESGKHLQMTPADCQFKLMPYRLSKKLYPPPDQMFGMLPIHRWTKPSAYHFITKLSVHYFKFAYNHKTLKVSIWVFGCASSTKKQDLLISNQLHKICCILWLDVLDQSAKMKISFVVFREGRVMGVLEVSRSIGDGSFKKHGVSCVPDVRRCQLTKDDR